MKYEKSTNSQNQIFRSIKPIIIGSLSGVMVCAVLLCLFSFVFVEFKSIPQGAVGVISIISSATSAFVGGYVTVRLSGERGMFYGMTTAFVLFFILLLVGVSVASEPFTFLSLVKLFSMVLLGALGGIIGVNKRRK